MLLSSSHLEVFDDLYVFSRVAGAVGQHDAVITARQNGFGRGIARQNGHFTAARLQFAFDVVLDTKVQQGDVVLGFALGLADGFLARW